MHFTSCQAAKEAADKEALAKKIKASETKKKKAKKDAAAKVRWSKTFDVLFAHIISQMCDTNSFLLFAFYILPGRQGGR